MQAMKKGMMVVLLMLVWAVSCQAAGQIVFQQGLNGYTGTRDDQITMNWGAELNRGAAEICGFQGVPWGGSKAPGFIGFDDIFGDGANQIPLSWAINSATLRVYVCEKMIDTTSNHFIQIWPMASPWTPGNTTAWASVDGTSTGAHRYYRADGNYSIGDYWGNAGQVTTGPVNGVDFNVEGDNSLRSIAYFTADHVGEPPVQTGEWMEFDVTTAVCMWQSGVIDNNGFYGFAAAYWQYVKWYSSEYTGDPSLRPMLVIDWEEGFTEPGPDTAVLKDGYNGYAGTADSRLNAGNINNGAATQLTIGGVPWGGSQYPCLLRFDDINNNLPVGLRGTDVNSAKLRIYVTETVVNKTTDYLQLFQMLTPFTEGVGVNDVALDGESTGYYRHYRPSGNYSAGDYWGTLTGPAPSNMIGPQSDDDYLILEDYGTVIRNVRAPIPSDPCHPEGSYVTYSGINQWVEFDITDMTKQWIDDAASNHGVFVFTNGYWQNAVFAASEYPSMPHRPELRIDYTPYACGSQGVPYPDGDVTADCYVNLNDVAAMADQWQQCTDPDGTGCVVGQGEYYIEPGTAVVDGNLNEWADAAWIQIDKVYADEPNDVSSAAFAAKWDAGSDKLFVAVTVEDGHHVLEDFPIDWNSSDRIEVYSCSESPAETYGWGGFGANYDYAQQYVVGKSQSPGWDWAFFGGGDAIPGSAEFEFAVVENGSQLIYELALKQFVYYGGISGQPTVVNDLDAGTILGLDVVVDTRYDQSPYGQGFGMLAENEMSQKSMFNDRFQRYTLLPSRCGIWGYLPADTNTDCAVDLTDLAVMANDWLYCTDPANPTDCDVSWQ